MTLKITTISENTAGFPGLLAEWGLSVLVETEDIEALLDTGAGISVPHNAPLLGIDLASIDKIVLSHGHYDHTGGLKGILQAAGKEIEVIAHPDVWGNKYSQAPGWERYIGIPTPREKLEALGARFTFSREPVWLTDDIVTTGEIAMTTEYEEIDPNMFIKEGGEFHPDPLLDDRALILKTARGLVVILGCAHRGPINTLLHAQEITGVEHVHAVIGGAHLVRASEERVMLTAAALKEMGVERVGVSHCTGLPASAILARELGDALFFNNAGTVVNVE